MILVDTSVLVNFLKGRDDEKTAAFDSLLSYDVPFGISGYTYQELLQGARDEKEFLTLKKYLSSQKIYLLPEIVKTYEFAAKLYYDARRKGITPRSTIDVLITYTAVYYGLFLLPDDRDFDALATIFSQLKIYEVKKTV